MRIPDLQITPEFSAAYHQLEEQMRPMIDQRARRVYRVDFDDAQQEGRIALLRMLAGLKWNQGGRMMSYFDTGLRNRMRDLARDAGRPCRTPAIAPISIGDEDCPEIVDFRMSPEQEVRAAQHDDSVRRFSAELMERLGERERQVLRCKIAPSRQLVTAEEVPTNKEVRDHLGMTRGDMARTMDRIRRAFIELCDEPEWRGMFDR